MYRNADIPCCIVYGEKDETGLHQISNEYLMEIPNCKVHMIENGPHACYLKQHNTTFHKIMLDFLNEIDK